MVDQMRRLKTFFHNTSASLASVFKKMYVVLFIPIKELDIFTFVFIATVIKMI